MLAAMVSCIAFFALLFAINSSIHSYLVVRYAEGNKVAQSVGFYYMGTIPSISPHAPIHAPPPARTDMTVSCM